MRKNFNTTLLCLLATTVLSAGSTNTLQIEPAVRLTIPSQDGKLYEIQASDDLNTWRSITTPLVGTGDELSHTVPHGPYFSRFFRYLELGDGNTNRIVGLRELDLVPAKFEALDNGIKVTGMRVVADGISRDDYLTAYFRFDSKHQSLRLDSYQIARDVGVFSDPYFAKVVGSHITLTNGTSLISPGVKSTVTYSGMPLTMNLVSGQVISFTFQEPTVDYHCKFINPQEQILYEAWGTPQAGMITHAVPIFVPGVHKLVVEPLNGSNLTYAVTFLNCNRRALTTCTNGYYVSASFIENSGDYAKYKIHLGANQLLKLNAPTHSADIRLTLVDSRSHEVVEYVGLPLVYRSTRDDDYYLFVDNQKGWGGSYSSYVTISELPSGIRPASALAPAPVQRFPSPTPTSP